ncbi:hypothetical protein Tco_0449769 [Tanacetum coccineum]
MEKINSLFASKFQNIDGSTKPISFASILKETITKKMVNLVALTNDEIVQGAHVAIPLVSVEEVSSHFANTLYGYFIGKRLAFPIVENYVRNAWAKALIEVSSETALMDSLVVDIPFQDRSGHNMKTIDIDYEWQPPRYDSCKIFDHNDDQCPKKIKVVVPNHVSDDGFVEVNHSFDTLMEKDKNFEVKNEPWKVTNDIGSKMDDSDSEEVKNVFVEDNRKSMNDLVDDAQKKVEAPPQEDSQENWDDMIFDDIGQVTEEVEHENA